MRTLRSSAKERTVKSPPVPQNAGGLNVRNPILWLREHSRYLAPNGPTDYGYAVAYLARNWVGMLYVFVVGMAGVLTLCALLDLFIVNRWAEPVLHWIKLSGTAGALPSGGCDITLPRGAVAAIAACEPVMGPARPPLLPSLPPMLLLAAIPQLGSLGVSVAYWVTCQMSPNERYPIKQARSFFTCLAGTALAGFVLSPLLWDGWVRNDHLRAWQRSTAGVFTLEILFALIWFGVALVTASPDQLLTSEMRRLLTSWQARFNRWVLIILALSLVEALAAMLRGWLWSRWALGAEVTVSVGSLLPILAIAIHKLQGWASGASGGSGWLKLATRFAPTIAMIVGTLLYGALAVAVSAAVQAAVWNGPAWTGTRDDPSTLLLLTCVTSLGLLTGLSTGFINLSSLHALYASRLTRAYLGATNESRLRTLEDPTVHDVTIVDNHHEDYVQPSTYWELDLPAPLHIINITANRTIDESSSIVARDRRGDLLSIEPEGIQLGTGHDRKLLRWSIVGERHSAESLSLGQWCAISGAAASSGMGRLTNLGYALALSFANVRLGYWWWVPAGRPPRPARPWYRRAWSAMGRRIYRFLSTFFYLFDEMTARYSRAYDRQYLSDGGHFENTGAYALLRRDVERIIVCDNAQDDGYVFGDLENLIRKARLDLGREIQLLSGPPLRSFLRSIGCARNSIFVDAEKDPAWKASMKDGRGHAFALAFQVRSAEPESANRVTSTLILLKPRLLPDLPLDVVGYAAANPPFPQQTTGDQFFDEAQWESYRRLGDHCMSELLDACPGLLRDRAAGGERKEDRA